MSLGRTAVTTKVNRNGVDVWRKQNSDPYITNLEYRIYTALAADGDFAWEAPVPSVELDSDPTVLYIEDLGMSLGDALHFGTKHNIADPAFLLRTVKIRAGASHVINRTLTEDDKAYLISTQRDALRASIERLSGASVSDADLATHHWAYRMLQAIGIYNEEVRDAYTTLIGSKIDAFMPLYGQWNADNCLRNNAVLPDGVVVIPFDFNSIRRELRQMDEASIVSFYMMNGPMGSSAGNAIPSTLYWLHKRFSFETPTPGTLEQYTQAYMLGSVHKHMMLSGYRTQEMMGLYRELDAHLSRHGWIPRDKSIDFRVAFDEVEYHQSLWYQSMQACPGLITSHEDESRADLIARFVFENTRWQRSRLIQSDVYGQTERILAVPQR